MLGAGRGAPSTSMRLSARSSALGAMTSRLTISSPSIPDSTSARRTSPTAAGFGTNSDGRVPLGSLAPAARQVQPPSVWLVSSISIRRGMRRQRYLLPQALRDQGPPTVVGPRCRPDGRRHRRPGAGAGSLESSQRMVAPTRGGPDVRGPRAGDPDRSNGVGEWSGCRRWSAPGAGSFGRLARQLPVRWAWATARKLKDDDTVTLETIGRHELRSAASAPLRLALGGMPIGAILAWRTGGTGALVP